jgi:hypothetical protein
VLTVIVTKITITGRSVCSTNSDVTITGRFICSVSSYCDNNDNICVLYMYCSQLLRQ